MEGINFKFNDGIEVLEEKAIQYKNPKTRHIFNKIVSFIDRLNSCMYVRLSAKGMREFEKEYELLNLLY